MKQILLVLTGGTIGSTVTDGIIDTNPATRVQLIERLRSCYPKHHEFNFHVIQPVELLSENLVPCVWETVIAAIEAEQPDRYDGIVITHGTDTLSFSAAALSFCLQGLKPPILLVSSDYPLDDAKANGVENFICALEFIRQIHLPGVFVPYRNRGQAMQVHWGTHLASSLQLSSDFISVQHKSYMAFDGVSFAALNPRIAPAPPTAWRFAPRFSERVLLVKPYPGLNYRRFDLSQTDAVLHDLYHSGTASVSAQWGCDYSLPEFINRCNKEGVKVYLAPAVKSADAYQSTRALIDLGAEIIWDMSLEAAYVKLLLAYGNFSDRQSIGDFMAADIAGEHV